MTDDNPYVPVACATHSEYELFIMHRNHLQLTWSDEPGNKHVAVVLPIDLITKDGQEFLLVENKEGKQQRIRLDRIQHYQQV